MKTKTSELKDRALDYAVALAEGALYQPESVRAPFFIWPGDPVKYSGGAPNYSTGPAGDDIIDKIGISVVRCNPLYFPNGNEKGDHYEPYWKAEWISPTTLGEFTAYREYGTTRREAAMRCFISAKLGEFIDIPEELLCDANQRQEKSTED